jgi:hypothetical protein
MTGVPGAEKRERAARWLTDGPERAPPSRSSELAAEERKSLIRKLFSTHWPDGNCGNRGGAVG